MDDGRVEEDLIKMAIFLFELNDIMSANIE